MNKIVADLAEAVAPVFDGAVVMVGGFGGSGAPHNLTAALAERGVKNLIAVCNSSYPVNPLIERRMVKKLICSFPAVNTAGSAFEEQYLAGELELELVPQGTLAERIRAGGAGIPAFYTPTGAGTELEEGKEKKVFNNRECLLEHGLTSDFTFIKAAVADRMGNLVFRKASRNFNPIMAMAARMTIAEVDEVVDAGEIDPETVVTPGIFVHRVVKAPKKVVWLPGTRK